MYGRVAAIIGRYSSSVGLALFFFIFPVFILPGTDVFRSLNVAMALDEGLANPGDKFIVFVGERGPWWLKVLRRSCPLPPSAACIQTFSAHLNPSILLVAMGMVLPTQLNLAYRYRIKFSLVRMQITSRGPPGHGSSFIKDTATYKLHRVLDRFLRHRCGVV
jgi:hypothetical protein